MRNQRMKSKGDRRLRQLLFTPVPEPRRARPAKLNNSAVVTRYDPDDLEDDDAVILDLNDEAEQRNQHFREKLVSQLELANK